MCGGGADGHAPFLVRQVTDKEAFKMCKRLAVEEGICCGGSTGLNVCAAVRLANETEEDGATIVTILCDLGVK